MSPPTTPLRNQALTKLREFCLSLPETRETTTFNNPTFQAGKKTFAVLDEYQGVTCIVFKVTPEQQKELVAKAPYFVAPHGGKHGWTAVELRPRMPWRKLHGLLLASYRLNALKRMIAQLDGVANA